MKYRTTQQADKDITALYVRGTVEFGDVRAESYVEGLFSTFELLAENPHIARERSEIDPPIRLHPYRSHLIAYVVRNDGILIVRVLHGRQDWQRHLS